MPDIITTLLSSLLGGGMTPAPGAPIAGPSIPDPTQGQVPIPAPGIPLPRERPPEFGGNILAHLSGGSGNSAYQVQPGQMPQPSRPGLFAGVGGPVQQTGSQWGAFAQGLGSGLSKQLQAQQSADPNNPETYLKLAQQKLGWLQNERTNRSLDEEIRHNHEWEKLQQQRLDQANSDDSTDTSSSGKGKGKGKGAAASQDALARDTKIEALVQKQTATDRKIIGDSLADPDAKAAAQARVDQTRQQIYQRYGHSSLKGGAADTSADSEDDTPDTTTPDTTTPAAPAAPAAKTPLTAAPTAPAQPSNAPPYPNARKAPDGNWYVADPDRPGKYLLVQ